MPKQDYPQELRNEWQRAWKKENRVKVNAAERKLYEKPDAREKKRARDRRAYRNRRTKMLIYKNEPDVRERDGLRRFAKEEMPDRSDVVLSRLDQPLLGKWESAWARQRREDIDLYGKPYEPKQIRRKRVESHE